MVPLRLPTAILVIGASVAVFHAGCGPNTTPEWTCLNPLTGRLDATVYDPTHYVNGVFDPCHCYDPSGESAACPIQVPTDDAGSD